MDLMSAMEAPGTSGILPVAAFFIGLMMAFPPCPPATNITAIAFISRNVGDIRHTILIGMAACVALTSMIVHGTSREILTSHAPQFESPRNPDVAGRPPA